MAKRSNIVGAHLGAYSAGAIIGTCNYTENLGVAQACVGTSLATALQLTADVNQVSTSSGQTACKLDPNAQPSDRCLVFNTSSTTALLFPGTATGTINGGSAGASISVAQNVAVEVVNIGGGDVWATTGNT